MTEAEKMVWAVAFVAAIRDIGLAKKANPECHAGQAADRAVLAFQKLKKQTTCNAGVLGANLMEKPNDRS